MYNTSEDLINSVCWNENEFNDLISFFNTVCVLHFLRQNESFLRMKQQRSSMQKLLRYSYISWIVAMLHVSTTVTANVFEGLTRLFSTSFSIVADLLSSFPMTGTSYKHLSLVYIWHVLGTVHL